MRIKTPLCNIHTGPRQQKTLSDISESKCNQPSSSPSSSYAQNKAQIALSNINLKHFVFHCNGCCITHSDMSGAWPSLWQHHNLPQPPIQKPTASKMRPFQVPKMGTKGKSVHNVENRMLMRRSLKAQNTFSESVRDFKTIS